MPSKEFFESWPLFKWHALSRAFPRMSGLPKPALRRWCSICESDQAFAMASDYRDGIRTHNAPLLGAVVQVSYLCASCQREEHLFFLKMSDDSRSIMKVGQFPEPRLATDPFLESALGANSDLFRQGMACETAGQGIGAFWYYRRLAEEILVPLLEDVKHLVDEFRLCEYECAVATIKQSSNPLESVALVKGLLPSVLRPKRIDLLGLLAAELAAAPDRLQDENGLGRAARARAILVFLLKQTEKARHDAESFAADISRMLAPSETDTRDSDNACSSDTSIAIPGLTG